MSAENGIPMDCQLCADKDKVIKYWRDLATEMQEKAVERGNKLRELRGEP